MGYTVFYFCIFKDVTAVCLLEGFQNQGNMMLADRILKSFGKELAEKHFKVTYSD